jgi:hypothetical protein
MNLTFAEYKAQSRNDIKEQEKSSYYDFEGVSDENETTRETSSGEFTSTSATTPEGAPS